MIRNASPAGRESGPAGDARRKGDTGMGAVQTGTRYTGTFHGRAEEVSRVRHEIAGYLGTCPAADDIILIADELAANAILHTQSRGSTFTVRCHASRGQVRIEVEDLGGPWRPWNPGDRPHGLDIIQALTGPDAWGTQPAGTRGRIVWARLSW
jgi:anti-sigma regulatory factor (Ser/Thr protein kinase)